MNMRIIIVDDHPILRDGIKALLREMRGVELVGEASNGREYLELVKDHETDLVLMDINMPEMDGIEASRESMKRYPNTKILVLSMYDDYNYYDSMVQIGVQGFLLKEANFNELQKAIESVREGKPYFSQELLLSILKLKKNAPNINLNDREKDVLVHICNGSSTAQIAEILHLSVSAIEKYRSELLLKTNCPNSTALAVYAIKNNLVDV
jgi:DNA-binding NarL/FixJ family response regulator